MDASRGAPGYDVFKSIVAIILLILFFVLLRMPLPQSLLPEPTASPPAAAIASDPTSTPVTKPTSLPETSTPISSQATESPTPSPTEMLTLTPTAASLPSPTGTSVDAPSETPLLAPTSTPEAEATSTSTAGTPAPVTACETAASRSRLEQEMSATILRRLNFRSSPGIRDNWLRTNIPGTSVEVVGGPECLPYYTGAYVWWQIRMPDGEIGWSAEGSVHGSFYFMEPSQ